MANGRIQIRVAPELETEANKIFEQMGMTPPQAIKLFLTQCVIQKKIPFPILGEEKKEDTELFSRLRSQVIQGEVERINQMLIESETSQNISIKSD